MDSRKKKILFLLQMPPPIYGASIVGQEIHDSKRINEEFETTYLNIVLTRNLNHPESAFFRMIRYFVLLIRLLAILCTHRFDMCYLAITCHGVGFLKDSLFVLVCKLFCKKIIIHQHNKGMSHDADKPIYRTLFPLVYKNTKVILLSMHLYDDISRYVHHDQILVCPNGSPWLVDPSSIPTEKATPHRIVFLSNLFFDKGILTFLDCCSILQKEGMRFGADVIGAETAECSRKRLLDEISNRSLTDYITYHGRQMGEDRNRILAQGTYFLFPTKNEAFPLVLLEAMQFGMICLSTSIGGIPDMIRDNETGFLCNADDASEFANRILQMEASGPERMKITENAFHHFFEKYTLESFEKNLIVCLEEGLA